MKNKTFLFVLFGCGRARERLVGASVPRRRVIFGADGGVVLSASFQSHLSDERRFFFFSFEEIRKVIKALTFIV